jgi:uncharacterized protein
MTTLKTLLLLVLVGYAGLLALLYVAQRSLMYFPDSLRTPPAAAGLPTAEEVTLATADGERVIAWHLPPRGENPVVVYFHGNGGSLRDRADRFRALTADGSGLLALSYRGYGGSSGSPSEAGLIADAEAAYAYAAARYRPAGIALYGESLGSAVAVAIAAAHPVGRVVLESPFTSAADVGAAVYWFAPVRWLIKDGFYSDRRIRRVTVPLLVLHGERDQVVPIRFGERLFALANEPKRLVRFAAGGHVDLDGHGAMQVVRKFLAGATP